jgi:hypothetical protein
MCTQYEFQDTKETERKWVDEGVLSPDTIYIKYKNIWRYKTARGGELGPRQMVSDRGHFQFLAPIVSSQQLWGELEDEDIKIKPNVTENE